MSRYEDLTWGHEHDNALKKVGSKVDLMCAQDDPMLASAALILLDEAYGLRKPDDYILISPAMLIWVLEALIFTDPEMANLVSRVMYKNERGDLDEDKMIVNELDRQLTSKVHEVGLPTEYDPFLPKELRGTKFRIRSMSEEECLQLDTLATTMRSDGNPVRLP